MFFFLGLNIPTLDIRAYSVPLTNKQLQVSSPLSIKTIFRQAASGGRRVVKVHKIDHASEDVFDVTIKPVTWAAGRLEDKMQVCSSARISVPHLVNQLSPGRAGLLKDVSPELWILPVH